MKGYRGQRCLLETAGTGILPNPGERCVLDELERNALFEQGRLDAMVKGAV